MKRLAALLTATILGVLLLAAPPAAADPGPNYVVAYTSAWYNAGLPNSCPDTGSDPHCLEVHWTPSTDYWKAEVNTQCPNSNGPSSETVDFAIYKDTTQAAWHGYYPTDSSNGGTDPVTEYDYPAGSGSPGYHTPDWTSGFDVFIYWVAGQFITSGPLQCRAQLVLLNHI